MTLSDLEKLKQKGLIRGFTETGKPEKPKAGKYGAVKTELDGHVFDSKKEAARYMELRYRLRAGEITDLEPQKEFELEVNGEKVASYFADFVYRENGEVVVEDVKSKATRKIAVYRLKKKLMKQIHGLTIKEV
jgi:hypothetical protein